MKPSIFKLSLIVGLLISFIYKILSRYVEISDFVAIPMFIISTALMLIGIAYMGWCMGKGKNPFSKV